MYQCWPGHIGHFSPGLLSTSTLDEEQSSGWGLVSTKSCFQFWHFQQTQKEFKLHQIILGFWADKIFKPLDQVAEFKFESKFEPLLPEAAKAISEGTQRFWQQNQ